MISKMIDGQEVLMSGTSPIYSEDLAYDNTQSGLSALNIQDAVDEIVSEKADKVASATNGNIASFDANGNLVDSGSKVSDLATEDEMSAVVNVYGSKNLLLNNAVTQTINGVTFTVNADKSITASGTATSDTVLSINNNQIVKAGSYIASYVAPGGGQGYTFVGDTVDGSSRIFHCNNDTPAPFTLSSDTVLNIYFWIASGVTMNVTLYPMIRDARITDATYAPYAMTNREMTDKFEELDTDFSRAQVKAISNDRIQTNSDTLSDNYKRMLSAGNFGSNPDTIYMQAAKTSANEATYQDMLMWCYNGNNLFADLVKNGQSIPSIDISRANIRPEYLTNADDVSSYINERLNWAMWNGNTLGTPYKTGQTVWAAGAIITTMYGNSSFAYQLCMPVGNGPLFYRGYSAVAAGGGGWTGWVPVADGNTLSSVYSRTAGIFDSTAATDLSLAIWQNRQFNSQYWDSNTLNTPYKQGATGMSAGLCITSVLNNGQSVYVNQVALPVGAAQMFIRSFNGSAWSSWSSVISGSVSGTTLNLLL